MLLNMYNTHVRFAIVMFVDFVPTPYKP